MALPDIDIWLRVFGRNDDGTNRVGDRLPTTLPPLTLACVEQPQLDPDKPTIVLSSNLDAAYFITAADKLDLGTEPVTQVKSLREVVLVTRNPSRKPISLHIVIGQKQEDDSVVWASLPITVEPPKLSVAFAAAEDGGDATELIRRVCVVMIIQSTLLFGHISLDGLDRDVVAALLALPNQICFDAMRGCACSLCKAGDHMLGRGRALHFVTDKMEMLDSVAFPQSDCRTVCIRSVFQEDVDAAAAPQEPAPVAFLCDEATDEGDKATDEGDKATDEGDADEAEAEAEETDRTRKRRRRWGTAAVPVRDLPPASPTAV